MARDVADAIAGPHDAAALAAIREFLSGVPSLAGAGGIGPGTPLLESGGLDSLGVLELMMFLGTRLRIEVADEDFVAENFATVGSLVRFVAAKQALVPA